MSNPADTPKTLSPGLDREIVLPGSPLAPTIMVRVSFDKTENIRGNAALFEAYGTWVEPTLSLLGAALQAAISSQAAGMTGLLEIVPDKEQEFGKQLFRQVSEHAYRIILDLSLITAPDTARENAKRLLASGIPAALVYQMMLDAAQKMRAIGAVKGLDIPVGPEEGTAR